MEDILKFIPHRPPFLFVDRIVDHRDGKITAEKTVRADEPYFQGHFPHRPIMPGVLICESVLQTGALLMSRQSGEGIGNRVPMVTRINNVKLRHAVRPGDVLTLEVELLEKVSNAWYMKGRAGVDGKTVLTLDFSGMLVEDGP